MRTRLIGLLFMAAFIGLLGVPGRADAAIIIDDFKQTMDHGVNLPGVGGPATNTQVGINPANTIGGSRQLDLTISASTFNQGGSLMVNTAAPGTVSLNLGSAVTGVGTVTYDNNGAGLGGVTLLPAGKTAASTFFQTAILDSDLNLGFQVDITETVAAGGSTATFSNSLGSGPSVLHEKLSDFANAANVDFSQIEKIVLRLTGPAGQDATIRRLETVPDMEMIPEPATLALGLLGALGLFGRLGRRRRR